MRTVRKPLQNINNNNNISFGKKKNNGDSSLGLVFNFAYWSFASIFF